MFQIEVVDFNENMSFYVVYQLFVL